MASHAAERIPGVAPLAAAFSRLTKLRLGRIPIGLLMLLPVAIFLDLFDIGDELVLGPVGMGISFVLESAFLLALTGRPSYSFGFAGLDLLPLVDTIPIATITLAVEIAKAWRAPPEAPPLHPERPVIDV